MATVEEKELIEWESICSKKANQDQISSLNAHRKTERPACQQMFNYNEIHACLQDSNWIFQHNFILGNSTG